MVGMSTEMVLFAMGQPESKSREIEGQMPFEEWIYGHPPQDVQFVRINGNRVIRVALAKLGQPLEIATKDEVEGLMTTDGKPVVAEVTHSVQLGDVQRDPNKQAPAAPPTLRAPGEKLPDDKDSNTPGTMSREGPMKPVIFPKDTTNDPARTVDAHPDATKAAKAKADADKADAAKSDAARKDAAAKDPDPAKPAGDGSGSKPAQAAPAQPANPQPGAPPPSSNFYPGEQEPANL